MKDESLYKSIDLSMLTFNETPISSEEALKDVNPFFGSIKKGLLEAIDDAMGNIVLKKDVLENGARP